MNMKCHGTQSQELTTQTTNTDPVQYAFKVQLLASTFPLS